MTQPQGGPEPRDPLPPEGKPREAGPIARLAWACLLAGLALLLTALHVELTVYWDYAHPVRMANFEAAAPFQYRVLVPAVAAALHKLSALDVEAAVALIEAFAWVALIALAHHALSVFGIGRPGLVRRMLALTVVVPMAAHLIAPDMKFTRVHDLGGDLSRLVEWNAEALYLYIYDLPAAAFVLALLLLLRRYLSTQDMRWLAAYLALFALATFNRETTLFLLPAFLVAGYGILPRTVLARGLLWQALVFVAIQGLLQWLFTDNVNPNARGVPGTQYELQLSRNLWLFANPLFLIVYLLRFGTGLYLPVLLLWRYLDPFLLRALLGFGVPFLAFVFLLGRIQEHRVVIELLPLLWLCALQAVAAWLAERPPARLSRPPVRPADA